MMLAWTSSVLTFTPGQSGQEKISNLKPRKARMEHFKDKPLLLPQQHLKISPSLWRVRQQTQLFNVLKTQKPGRGRDGWWWWCSFLRDLCGVLIWEDFPLHLHSLGAFPCFKQNIPCCFPFPALLQTNTPSQKMQEQPSIKDDAIPATAPFMHLQKPCQEIVAAFYTRVPGNMNKSLVPSKCEHKNLIKVRFFPN